ncbi:MAG: hypothetical protein KDA85_03695, partial [Planctomycetaceae bacterium]|nr:hypothetical protein [Planctomycetaceae bacterium]
LKATIESTPPDVVESLEDALKKGWLQRVWVECSEMAHWCRNVDDNEEPSTRVRTILWAIDSECPKHSQEHFERFREWEHQLTAAFALNMRSGPKEPVTRENQSGTAEKKSAEDALAVDREEPPVVKGISLLDAALAVNDGDNELAKETKKRWERDARTKLNPVGTSSRHRQRLLYELEAMLQFIREMENDDAAKKCKKVLALKLIPIRVDGYSNSSTSR